MGQKLPKGNHKSVTLYELETPAGASIHSFEELENHIVLCAYVNCNVTCDDDFENSFIWNHSSDTEEFLKWCGMTIEDLIPTRYFYNDIDREEEVE